MIRLFLFSQTLMVAGIFFIISGMSLLVPGVLSQPPPKPYGALPTPAQLSWQETEYEDGVWQSLGNWTSIGANRLIRLRRVAGGRINRGMAWPTAISSIPAPSRQHPVF